MTEKIYYYDFEEQGDSYRLGFYINDGAFATEVEWVKCKAKSLIFDNDLSFATNMPDDAPFGLQLADTLKLKINLLGNNLPFETLEKGYNGSYSNFYKSNVWFLYRWNGTNWTNIFYGFQQIKESNETSQDKLEEIILDLELISIHKFLMEKVTLDSLLTMDLLNTDTASVTSVKILDLDINSPFNTFSFTLYDNHKINSDAYRIYLTQLTNILAEISRQIMTLGEEFTANSEFSYSISESLLDHIQFYLLNNAGAYETIEIANNKELQLSSLVYDGAVGSSIESDKVLGGTFSTNQKNGLTEYKSVYDMFAKLCEQLVVMGAFGVGAMNNTDNKPPLYCSLSFSKAYDTSLATNVYFKDFATSKKKKQGELLSKLAGNRKEVTEDDLNLIEINNAGIFNEKSYELQEIFNTNYNCISSTTDITTTELGNLKAENVGIKGRTLYYHNEKIAEKVIIDIGDQQFTDSGTSFSGDWLDYSVTDELRITKYNAYCVATQMNSGLTWTALNAINYLMSGYISFEVTTKKELYLGQIINVVDGLFYVSSGQWLGAGKYKVVGVEKTFWGETKVKLFRKL